MEGEKERLKKKKSHKEEKENNMAHTYEGDKLYIATKSSPTK